ncbi:MAG: MBL fold metallo-hydrolase [bacterium]
MNGVFEYLNMITVNQHSSVRLSASGKVLYVDPFELPAAPKDADFIFLTHSHFDHFSPKDIEKLCKPETVFVLPASMEAEAAQTTQGHRVAAVGPSDHVVIDDLRFETIPAYNPKKPFHPRENAWVGYLLQVNGLRVYIAGDTDATQEAAAVRCDVAMLPIGGKYTMDGPEAAALTDRIRPRVVIPIHYGSVAGSLQDFDRFAAKVDPSVTVRRVI